MANQMDAMSFMQLSMMVRTFVPYIAFIDRKGIIRAQFTGGDLADETLDKVLRENAEKLVNEPAGPAKPKAKRSSP
jgi:hypothetical protein